jgi:hypothetical protein
MIDRRRFFGSAVISAPSPSSLSASALAVGKSSPAISAISSSVMRPSTCDRTNASSAPRGSRFKSHCAGAKIVSRSIVVLRFPPAIDHTTAAQCGETMSSGFT